jgi:hypothetical protein
VPAKAALHVPAMLVGMPARCMLHGGTGKGRQLCCTCWRHGCSSRAAYLCSDRGLMSAILFAANPRFDDQDMISTAIFAANPNPKIRQKDLHEFPWPEHS